MSKRYAACGLSEQTLLADAIELYIPLDGQAFEPRLLPVLTGLAARNILKPHLKNGLLNPPLIKQLFSATGEAVKLLAIRGQLKALPGLIARLNQQLLRQPIQNRHGLSQLPQQLDQATLRVTQNPQLYQHLCRLSETITAEKSPPSANPDSPQRLRIHGPVEILFRRLDE
ncbi:MAG: hypothetical protein HC800_09410 [Phormidesmis sp. RL_2_1]|nr:hypothetical protein [Phormidesmis sp. RL_2_1]